MLTLPPIIRTSEPGSWAYHTFKDRIPRIIDDVIAQNDYPLGIVRNLRALRREIVAGKIRVLKEQTDDRAFWNEHAREHIGKSWLDVPWYWAEAFFYRRVLEAVKYFQPGKFYHHDPYASVKRQELAPDRAPRAVNSVLEQLEKNQVSSAKQDTWFLTLLHADLWGNRVDLSMYNIANARQNATSFEHERANLLVDHTARVWEHLIAQRGARIDFICDNAGTELLFDLLFVDFLLRAGIANQVILHLKPQPTFVSDAMIKDVRESIDATGRSNLPLLRQMATRLAKAIDQGTLMLIDHPFWVTGFFFHAMPNDLRALLAQADLVISKGDANYRRLVGDCHWDPTTSFDQAAEYFPAPLVALRTLKSEPIVGLRPGVVEGLRTQDPTWNVSGKYGVIQFSHMQTFARKIES